MNSYRLNGIVEYIRTQSEFPFDVLDVEDGLEEVLAYFGFHADLDDQERTELRAALGEMAGEAEWAEIARVVSEEQQRALSWVGERPCPEVMIRIHRRPKSVAPGPWMEGLTAQ